MSDATHEVRNQPPPPADHDAWASDPWLRAAVERAGAGDIAAQASALGGFVGSAEGAEHARVPEALARGGLDEKQVAARRNRDVPLEHDRVVPEARDHDGQQAPDVGLHLADQDARHGAKPVRGVEEWRPRPGLNHV